MAGQNGGAAQNYATVEAGGSAPQGMGHGEPGQVLVGATGRFDGRGHEDDYTQAGNLFRLLPRAEKQSLFDNLAKPLSQVSQEIRERQLGHFYKADEAYGNGVRLALKELGINAD